MNTNENVNEMYAEADLSRFGFRELKEVQELLGAYIKSGINIEGLKIGFNLNSGYVFLTSEDYDTYMMNGDKLEQFFSCPECGHEGFKDEFENQECNECKAIAQQKEIES